jgi:hypothetical protein
MCWLRRRCTRCGRTCGEIVETVTKQPDGKAFCLTIETWIFLRRVWPNWEAKRLMDRLLKKQPVLEIHEGLCIR